MVIQNRDIAEVFEKIASLLSLQDANPFRIRAYRNAASEISRWPEELSTYLINHLPLPKIPGIGDDLSAKIKELLSTNRLSFLDELTAKIPIAVTDLFSIAGLGPKRVKALWQSFGITGIEELKKFALSGKLRTIPGFGEALEKKILESIEQVEKTNRRFPYDEVLEKH